MGAMAFWPLGSATAPAASAFTTISLNCWLSASAKSTQNENVRQLIVENS